MNIAELGRGVFAFTHPIPKFGNSNVGLVIDHDGLTFIDTTATPHRALEVAGLASQLTAELDLPLKRVVLSSSRIPFVGGSASLWKSAFYSSEATSAQLDSPANPDSFRRLLPELADAFPDDFTTRPATHVITAPTPVTPATHAVCLPGESETNLVMYVESADVVFAGALASFGVTPLAFDGFLKQWAESLDQLTDLAGTIIPGHGPPGGAQDAANLALYLRACIRANGKPEALEAGPWDDWTDQQFHPINIERAARLQQGDYSIPTSMYRLLGFQPEG